MTYPFDSFTAVFEAVDTGQLNAEDVEIISVKQDGIVDVHAVATAESSFIDGYDSVVIETGYDGHADFGHIHGRHQLLAHEDGETHGDALQTVLRDALDVSADGIGVTTGRL